MKYFIFKNNQIEEVKESYYRTWIRLFGHEFKSEDYSLVNRNMVHTITSTFYGAFDTNIEDNPEPFILFYHKGKLLLTNNGIRLKQL